MVVWVLFVIAFIGGSPVADYKVYPDKVTCEAMQAKVQEALIKQGVEKGSLNCIETKIGAFS